MSTALYDDGPDPADRLDAILAEYLDDIEAGRPPNRELLLARHPDLAEELREFFADRDSMKSRANRLRFIVPKFIGDYQLLEEIGSGTFGVVVKARHIKLDKLVAIKLLRGEQWSSPEYVRRFKTEARKAAKLDHPHIVPVHVVGEHEGQHYYEMKFIEGGSLTQRLRNCSAEERSTRRHQRWAAELMVKIAQAVHHAHQHAIIHRDLKPGNILLDAAGQPLITDFGLAKQLEEHEQIFELGEAEDGTGGRERLHWEGGPEADTVMTEKGSIVGTAPYMSPQQASGQEATMASDVYSLGVILYEMLTGQVPIRGENPEETIRLIQEQTPPRPRSLNPRIDYRLERICLKCLQKNPPERYGAALSLAHDLKRWLNDEPLVGLPGGFAERCQLWCRRNPLGAGLTATAALLLILVTTVVLLMVEARKASLKKQEDDFHAGVEKTSLEIANRFSRYEQLLEQLRGSAVVLLTRVEPGEDKPVFLAGNEQKAPDYENPSVVIAPTANVEQKTLQRLMLLRDVFKRTMVWSRRDIKVQAPNDQEIRTLLTKKGVPIAWVYVALEEGVDCTYPGMGGFPDNYDPRDRPWYKAAAPPNRGVNWVGPYDDVLNLGRMLSCSAPIYDYKGKFLGVAGFDLLEEFVTSEILRMTHEPHVDAFLVDGQGKVLIPNVNGNLPSEVVQEIKKRRQGHIRTNDKLAAYFRLNVSDWYFVVVADMDHIQDVLNSMRQEQHDSE